MAENDISPYQLKLISEREFHPIPECAESEVNMLNAFACGLQLSVPEATEESAQEAVCQLDYFCPVGQDDEPLEYLWLVWDIMLDIARSLDITMEVHIHLMKIPELLRLSAKGEIDVYGNKYRLWRDLPLLNTAIEARVIMVCFPMPLVKKLSNTLTRDLTSINGDFDPSSAQIWWNLNSFYARTLGAGIAGPYDSAMYALRSGLEEELDMSTPLEIQETECRIMVACELIRHAAKPLIWWAQENIGVLTVYLKTNLRPAALKEEFCTRDYQLCAYNDGAFGWKDLKSLVRKTLAWLSRY